MDKTATIRVPNAAWWEAKRQAALAKKQLGVYVSQLIWEASKSLDKKVKQE